MGYFGNLLKSEFFSTYFSGVSETPVLNAGYFGSLLPNYYFGKYFSKVDADEPVLVLCGAIVEGSIQFGSIVSSKICGGWTT